MLIVRRLQCSKPNCKHVWITKTDKIPNYCPHCVAPTSRYKPIVLSDNAPAIIRDEKQIEEVKDINDEGVVNF